MSNSFEVYGSSECTKAFIESSINTAKEIISHYDFVINDISSEISDARLETTKGPTLIFLKKMRSNWIAFQMDLEDKLNNIKKEMDCK